MGQCRSCHLGEGSVLVFAPNEIRSFVVIRDINVRPAIVVVVPQTHSDAYVVHLNALRSGGVRESASDGAGTGQPPVGRDGISVSRSFSRDIPGGCREILVGREVVEVRGANPRPR